MKRLGTATLVVAVFTALLASTAVGWSNVYGTDGVNEYSSAEAVELLPDGSAIVAGCFDGTFNGRTSTNGLDTFVMKISPEGETLWTYSRDGDHQQDCFDSGDHLSHFAVDGLGNSYLIDKSEIGLEPALLALGPNGSPLDATFPTLTLDAASDPLHFDWTERRFDLWPRADGLIFTAGPSICGEGEEDEAGWSCNSVFFINSSGDIDGA